MVEIDGRSSGGPETPASQRPLNNDEKLIVVPAMVSAACCFLPWFSVSVNKSAAGGLSMPEMFASNMSANAFSFTEGIFVFVLSLVAAAVPFVFSQGLVAIPKRTAVMLPLAASALAGVCALIFMGRGNQFMGPISAERTLWFFVGLLAIVFTVFRSFKYWQANQPGSSV